MGIAGDVAGARGGGVNGERENEGEGEGGRGRDRLVRGQSKALMKLKRDNAN